jgi:chromosome partitioning protein
MGIHVCGGEKGGTGKTCFATNLAVCLAVRGRDVLLVDADPQRSSARWASRRAAFTAETRPPWATEGLARVPWVELQGEIFEALLDLSKRYSDIVVDVGGADSVEFRDSLVVADALWSPMLPSDCDVGTAAQVAEVVRQARSVNKKLKGHIVMNGVDPQFHGRDLQYAREELVDFATLLPVSERYVCQRRGFRTAFNARVGVVEIAGQAKGKVKATAQQAADEMWSLYSEITGEAVNHAAAE